MQYAVQINLCLIKKKVMYYLGKKPKEKKDEGEWKTSCVCPSMCLRLAWRREEGNTHRVSQACPEHEPSTSTTFKYTHKHTHSHYTCTPAVPQLTHPYTHTHTGTAMYMLAVQRTDTRSNFYPAIMKFMQSHNGHVRSSSSRAENISSSLTRCLVSQR